MLTGTLASLLPSVSANAKALCKAKQTNTTILNINTNAVTKSKTTEDAVGLQSSSAAENLRQSSVPMNVAVCKAEDMQSRRQSDQQNRLPQYRHQRCHSGGKGDGGGEEDFSQAAR
jgi:hypothetical protein